MGYLVYADHFIAFLWNRAMGRMGRILAEMSQNTSTTFAGNHDIIVPNYARIIDLKME